MVFVLDGKGSTTLVLPTVLSFYLFAHMLKNLLVHVKIPYQSDTLLLRVSTTVFKVLDSQAIRVSSSQG